MVTGARSLRGRGGARIGGRHDRHGIFPAAVVNGVQGGEGFNVPRAVKEGRGTGLKAKLGRTET